MTDQELADRLGRVEEEICRACQFSGRSRQSVRLLAVSKFQPAAAIASLAQAGQYYFGENYIQEAFAKRQELAGTPFASELRWDMIGHIQSRKAALAAGEFDLIHTLDSMKLANGLEKKLIELDKRQKVLIEINIGEEPQKAGIIPQDLNALANQLLDQAPHLELLGLMCLPPVFDAGELARPYFAKLRKLRDDLEKETGLALPVLSMGMSGDFMVAIEEGATIVRVGTAIFGARPIRRSD